MKFLILIILLSYGCNRPSQETRNNELYTVTVAPQDTTAVEIDEYTITDKMIADNISVDTNSPTDQIVFESEASNEIIYMLLATDYYRATSIHYASEYSDKLIYLEEFKNIQQSINDKSLNSIILNHSFFQTKKGLKLGDSKTTVLMTYGPTNKTQTIQDLEILQWDYFGEELREYEENTENYRIA